MDIGRRGFSRNLELLLHSRREIVPSSLEVSSFSDPTKRHHRSPSLGAKKLEPSRPSCKTEICQTRWDRLYHLEFGTNPFRTLIPHNVYRESVSCVRGPTTGYQRFPEQSNRYRRGISSLYALDRTTLLANNKPTDQFGLPNHSRKMLGQRQIPISSWQVDKSCQNFLRIEQLPSYHPIAH